MKEGYSIRQLSDQSGLYPSKLYRIIDCWLKREPPTKTTSLASYKYMIFDGSFIHKNRLIVVLMDAQTNSLIHGAYAVNERSRDDLVNFFVPLRERGLNPRGCTVDGNQQIAVSLRQVWPEIVIQRCIVHVQRQGLSWCRQRPKRRDAVELRKLFLRLSSIDTCLLRDEFLADVEAWECQFGQPIADKPGFGKVFSDLKRARSMLLKALPNLFHYLEDTNLQKSTNGLEGYFSRMKKLYRNHCGLTRTENYCKWYFHFARK